MRSTFLILTVLALVGCSSSSQVDKYKEVQTSSAMYCGKEGVKMMLDVGDKTMLVCENGKQFMYDDRSALEKFRDKFISL